jgi:hypothetical protein
MRGFATRPPKSSPGLCRITGRATLVGTRSFGKGSVQTIIPLGCRPRGLFAWKPRVVKHTTAIFRHWQSGWLKQARPAHGGRGWDARPHPAHNQTGARGCSTREAVRGARVAASVGSGGGIGGSRIGSYDRPRRHPGDDPRAVPRRQRGRGGRAQLANAGRNWRRPTSASRLSHRSRAIRFCTP